jgi:LCP family protein required for cell wall assembly
VPEVVSPTASPEGPKRRGSVKKRHTVLKVVVATAVVLGLVTGLAVVYAYRHLNGNIQTLNIDNQLLGDQPEKVKVEGPHEPLNILVMGTDTRNGAGNNIDGLTGDGSRSDTTILLHLSADRKRAYGVSIPRDALVTRPDCKKADGDVVSGGSNVMWNEAFNVAGPACTISQFQHLTDIKIDHFVVVNFAGFRDMVDAVGGVEVCLPETIDDRAHGIYLKAGTRTITGKEALSYVRVRHVGNGSDLGRIKRQQAFVASMAHKVISAGTLANPLRLFRFLDAATKSLVLDEGMKNLRQIAEVGIQFRHINLDKIQFITAPWEYDPADPNRVRLLPSGKRLWKRLRSDEPLTKAQTKTAISAQNVPSKSGSPSTSGSASPSGSASTPTSPSAPTSNPSAEAEAQQAGLCT